MREQIMACPYCLPMMLALAVSVSAEVKDKPKINHAPPENVSAAKGPEMFRAYCSVCHGKDGQGGGPAADALKKRPADLTQLTRKNRGVFPKAKVESVIQGDTTSGPHGSRDMPIWGNVFRSMGKPEIARLRIVNLTAYLESLQRQ
jgi:mono/diheme cytochrome c family protein